MSRKRFWIEGDDPEWKDNVGGVSVKISLSRESGKFRCSIAGDYIYAETKDALVAEIKKRVKKTAIEVRVQVTLITDNRHGKQGTRQLMLRKISLATGRILAVDMNGAKYQFERWDDRNVLRRLAPSEVEEYEILERSARRSAQQLEAFIEKRKIKDVRALVEQEIRKAEDDPNEPEPEED